MQLFKQSKHIKAEEQTKSVNSIISPAPASAPIHMSENDLRQTLKCIQIRAHNLILELKREKHRSIEKNEDVYMLIDDLIWSLEDILSLCDRT